MNKKGFTLIEVTAVVLLLAILTVFIVPKVNTIIANNKDKACNSIITSIEDAAKNYAYLNSDVIDNAIANDSYFEIALLELQREGLLKLDLENPHTGNIISNTNVVKITKNGNVYTYTYMGDECK